MVTKPKVYKQVFYSILEVKMYGRLERQETKIIVPHLDGELTAFHSFLRGSYFDLARQIDKEQRSTMAEASSVLRYGYENDCDIAKYIMQMMKSNYGHFFNGILYAPKEGGYIENDPKFAETAVDFNGLEMNRENLRSRLGSREEKGVIYSDDGLVRFVPFGFRTGEQTCKELAENPCVIALAGEEGAYNLSCIASNHSKNPYLNTPIIGNESVKKVVALGSCWYGVGLVVDGNNPMDSDIGFSFRVVRKKNSNGNQG